MKRHHKVQLFNNPLLRNGSMILQPHTLCRTCLRGQAARFVSRHRSPCFVSTSQANQIAVQKRSRSIWNSLEFFWTYFESLKCVAPSGQIAKTVRKQPKSQRSAKLMHSAVPIYHCAGLYSRCVRSTKLELKKATQCDALTFKACAVAMTRIAWYFLDICAKKATNHSLCADRSTVWQSVLAGQILRQRAADRTSFTLRIPKTENPKDYELVILISSCVTFCLSKFQFGPKI